MVYLKQQEDMFLLFFLLLLVNYVDVKELPEAEEIVLYNTYPAVDAVFKVSK